MCTRSCLPALLLCLAFPTAHAQSCADQIQHSSLHAASHIVSARSLRIPHEAWDHLARAQNADGHKQARIAEQEIARALELAPNFAEAYLLRALRAVHEAHYDLALASVATARGIDPDLPWSNVIAASVFNQLKRFTEAAAELDHDRGEDAASWQANYERTRAQTGLGNAAAALHWSELTLAQAPLGCTAAHLVRANALQLAGRKAEVTAELEAYLAEDQMGIYRAQVLAALAKTHGADPVGTHVLSRTADPTAAQTVTAAPPPPSMVASR